MLRWLKALKLYTHTHTTNSKRIKKEKGITLIALIITIIILLILAGITLNLISGEQSILKRALTAVNKNKAESAKEQVELLIASYLTEFYEERQGKSSYEKSQKEYVAEKLQKGVIIDEFYVKLFDGEKINVYEGKQENDLIIASGILQENTSIEWEQDVKKDDSNEEDEPNSNQDKITNLYVQGNDCATITGGWEFFVNEEPKTTTTENKSYSSEYGSYEITPESLSMMLKPVANYNVGSTNEFKTKQKIDLTPFEKIGILAEMEEMKDYGMLGITENENYNNIRDLSHKVTVENNQITYLDISELTGEYYIQFGSGSYLSANAKIYKIWLEEKEMYANIECGDFVKKGETLGIHIYQKSNCAEIDLQKSKYVFSNQPENIGIESRRMGKSTKL